MNDPCMQIAWTTVEKVRDAEALAKGMLEQGIVACVQVDAPTRSYYKWKGRLETTDEIRLMLKFQSKDADSVKQYIEKHHPYDTPQWVVVDVSDTTMGYADWVRSGS